jgi:hypothetical protein
MSKVRSASEKLSSEKRSLSFGRANLLQQVAKKEHYNSTQYSFCYQSTHYKLINNKITNCRNIIDFYNTVINITLSNGTWNFLRLFSLLI